MSGRATNKGLELRLDIAPQIPLWLFGDAVKIRQIILNLIGNAIKFTDSGQVTVSLFPTDQPDHYRFQVSDTGKGIKPEHLTEIFEAFGQASANLSQPGTGLGLSISEKLIEVMGGEISVTSEEGKGSQFFFTLKLPEGETQKIDDTPLCPLTKSTVLLVEDNALNRTVAEGYLKHLGQAVISAENCAEALSIARSERFDLILMDINLPDGDGVTLTGQMREIIGKDIPIFAASAHAFEEDHKRFLEAGMNGCLRKPLRINDLSRVLAELSPPEQPTPEPTPVESLDNTQQVQDDIEILGLDTVQNLASLFCQTAPKTIESLINADDNDWEPIEKQAHEIKGAAASMALTQLYKLAADIEVLAKRQESTSQLRKQLKALQQSSVEELQQYLGSYG